MASTKTRPAAAKKTAVASAAAPAAPKKLVMPSGTKGVPLNAVKANKDMSPEAVAARRSAAQKAAPRMVRTTTVALRAKQIDVTPAGEGEQTAYDTLKEIWSSRGEFVTNVGGVQLEVKRSDVIRTLEQLPRDAKSPLKVVHSETDKLVHILEGV
jgi:hypothetical protein